MGLAILFTQFLDKFLAVVPGHSLDGQILPLEVARVVAHHHLPLFLRDWMDAKIEPLG